MPMTVPGHGSAGGSKKKETPRPNGSWGVSSAGEATSFVRRSQVPGRSGAAGPRGARSPDHVRGIAEAPQLDVRQIEQTAAIGRVRERALLTGVVAHERERAGP